MSNPGANQNRILVIGIGNEYRGDDSVGLYVAGKLSGIVPAGCDVKQQPGEGAHLVNSWEGYDHVIIIDAVRSASAPGTVIRIDALTEELPPQWVHHSAHTVSLPEAVALARNLDLLPRTLLIFGIEGVNFEPGSPINDDVKQAANDLILTLVEELRQLNNPG